MFNITLLVLFFNTISGFMQHLKCMKPVYNIGVEKIHKECFFMIRGLPDRLKQLRTETGLSQKEIAKLLQVSPSIISSYETGERTPSLENLLMLSNVFKCSTDYLLGKENNLSTFTIGKCELTRQQADLMEKFIKSIKET